MKFEKEIVKKVQLDYLLYLPEAYEDQSEWPLILFLHGAGEVGDNLQMLKQTGLPNKLLSEDIPFIVVAPQCPHQHNWNMLLDDLKALLDDVEERYKVNKKQIYLTGLSMGGFGTWALASKYPDSFAAIAPICGGLMNRTQVLHLIDTPIWAFHGANDSVVPVDMTRRLVAILKENNGHIQYTEYPDTNHDSWTKTYANPELYEWFLKYSI